MVSQTGLEPATLCTPCIDSTFEILAVELLVLEAELLFEFANFRFDERRGPLGLDEAIATLAGLALDSVEAEPQVFDAVVVAEGVTLARSDGEDAHGFPLRLTATLDAFDVLDVVHMWLYLVWLYLVWLESGAPEGAGIYQMRPMVTQRAIRNAVSRTRATTHRVPICCLFMFGCWLLVDAL